VDPSTNAAIQVTRIFDVMGMDTQAPIITPESIFDPTTPPGFFQLSLTDLYIESCSVLDDDPAYTGTCGIESGLIDTSVIGPQSVTYSAPADAAGNEENPYVGTPDDDIVQLVVSTEIIDTIAPTISLVGSNPIILVVGDTYADSGATVSDNNKLIDGTLALVNIPPELIGATTAGDIGSHTVTYTATDGPNVATPVTRTVQVTSVNDTVDITRSDYQTGSKWLRVDATSTNPNSILSVYSSDEFGGNLVFLDVMDSDGSGNYDWRERRPNPVPTHITVISNNGGLDTAIVT